MAVIFFGLDHCVVDGRMIAPVAQTSLPKAGFADELLRVALSALEHFFSREHFFSNVPKIFAVPYRRDSVAAHIEIDAIFICQHVGVVAARTNEASGHCRQLHKGVGTEGGVFCHRLRMYHQSYDGDILR